jgi:hypothetical protein
VLAAAVDGSGLHAAVEHDGQRSGLSAAVPPPVSKNDTQYR